MSDQDEEGTLLGSCRVLDLTDEKGYFCGKILGDLGADVIKFEKPGGDSGRDIGPFYKDIIDRRTVLSARTRSSKIIVGDAPVFERYYAGGIGSIRGFEYRGISPRSGPQDDPVGSEYIITAGMDLTHPLFEETLYGKIFCDGCMIDDGPGRVSVGFGIELVIPQLFQMIPMEFDFAFPIASDKENDEEQMFSFNFGMGF